jgi:hypothetical protein
LRKTSGSKYFKFMSAPKDKSESDTQSEKQASPIVTTNDGRENVSSAEHLKNASRPSRDRREWLPNPTFMSDVHSAKPRSENFDGSWNDEGEK